MIGYPPTSVFAICEFVATSMSIQGWISGTNPIIDGVPAKAMRGCEPTCVRDRAYGVVAGSLIASRSQFAHAAYKTPHFEILELFFCKASSQINLFLTGSHSRESLQNKRWAKMPQTAPPNLQILF
jgi:hypothetical protein